MLPISQNDLKITSKYIVWSSVGVLLPIILVYLFNGNIFKFQFLFFLVQLSVLGYFSFRVIYEVRMSYENKTISFLHAWVYVFLLLVITLLVFLFVKLIVLFLIDPSYLHGCVEQIKLDIATLAEKNPELEKFDLKKFDELKEFKSYVHFFWYYPLKSLVLSALIALVARKK
jgi:hypothetical protein